MDATRTRRTKDRARQAWYAKHRQRRLLGSWDSPRTPLRLQDADGGKPILLHNCPCF